MKIGLRGGHSPNCKGAMALRDEQSCMKVLADEVERILVKKGHTVVRCETILKDEREDVRQGAKKGQGCDIFISLHMNASNGNGQGTEAYTAVGARDSIKQIATRLCKNFSTLGLVNRGVKEKNYWEMNDTSCPNIIFETMFCDNKHDINDIWSPTPYEKMALLIANAIDPTIKEKELYKVTVQYFNSKLDAEKAQTEIAKRWYCFVEEAA